jgi:hypothetical protein
MYVDTFARWVYRLSRQRNDDVTTGVGHTHHRVGRVEQ